MFTLLVLGCLAGSPVLAQTANEQYVRIYDVIQEADALYQRGLLEEALPKYTDALTALQHFRKGYPAWNPDVIKFRLDYLAEKTAELLAKAPNAPPQETAPAPAPAKPARADWEEQLKALQGRVQQLQSDRHDRPRRHFRAPSHHRKDPRADRLASHGRPD